MNRFFYLVLCLPYLLGFTIPQSLFAQLDPSAEQFPDSALETMIEALYSGSSITTTDLLEEYYSTDPTWYSPTYYSLAYWLGYSHFESGNPNNAFEVWKDGATHLADNDLFDPRLALALVNHIFSNNLADDFGLGARLYILLLEQYTPDLPSDIHASLDLYIKSLFHILPATIKTDLDWNRLRNVKDLTWTPSTGTTLSTWWRSKDPAPATRINEVLQEHLLRIAYAKKHFMQDGRIDDRGVIYIRLGKPSRTTEINFESTSFRNKVLDRSLTINSSDFPKNEFWYYDHIDDTAHYLFYNRSDGYKIGQIENLLPASLRTGLGSSERGRKKARHMVRALEEIYRQLSLYHQDFSIRYQDVAAFSALFDDAEVIAELNATFQSSDNQVDDENVSNNQSRNASRQVDYAASGLPGGAFNPERPDLFVNSITAQDRAADEMQAARRDEYVPSIRSSTLDHLAPLPLHIRHARFLAQDGTTNTEIYWAAPSGAFELEPDTRAELLEQNYHPNDYLVMTSSIQKTSDYRDRVINHHRMLMKDILFGEDISIGDRTVIAKGDTGLYHVAIQWDQYLAVLDGAGSLRQLGPHLKANVLRLDSLEALRNDDLTLEMSDLKPMIVLEEDRTEPVSIEDFDQAIVYPAAQLYTDTPLLLYFEMYNLTYGANDRTSYTIEYTIQEQPGDALRLRRRRNPSTSFRSTLEGDLRNTREQLILDLSDWRGNGSVDIQVNITDEHTKQQVNRSISFDLASGK